MIVDDEDDGFGEEAQRGFEPASGVDAYTGLYALVLTAYDYRCALTGGRFPSEQGKLLHADLEVVAVQPRHQGGPLSVSNYLPMITSLVPVFRNGLIVVQDDYRITVPHPELLDRMTLSALRATLVVPAEPFRLDPVHLAHHRRYALGR